MPRAFPAAAAAAPTRWPPAPLSPPPRQSEIRVSVEGNVVRFGHQAHPDREQKDEREEGVFHRSERVRWGLQGTAVLCQLPSAQPLAAAPSLALPSQASSQHARLRAHPPACLPSAAPSAGAPCACPTMLTCRPSRQRWGGVLLCCWLYCRACPQGQQCRPSRPGEARLLPYLQSWHCTAPVLPPPAPPLQYEDGVLELRIGKRAAEQPRAEGRTIEIA